MNDRLNRICLSLTVAAILLTTLWCAGAHAGKGDGGNHYGGNQPPTGGSVGGSSADAASTASAASTSNSVSSAIGGQGGIGGSGGLGGSVSGFGDSSRFYVMPGSGSPAPLPGYLCPQGDSIDWAVGWNFFRYAKSTTRTELECLEKVLAAVYRPPVIEPRLPPLQPGEPLHPPTVVVPPPVVKPATPPPVVKPHRHHVKHRPPVKPADPPPAPAPVVIQAGPNCPNGQTLICRSDTEHRAWWHWW